MAVSFEKFLEIRIEIERGQSRRASLARHGLSALQWHAAQRRWTRVLTREAERGGSRYGSRYLAALEGGNPPQAGRAASTPIAAPVMGTASEVPVAAAIEAMDPMIQYAPPDDVSSLDTTLGTAGPSLAPTLPFREGEAMVPPSAADEVAREAEDLVGETGFVAALSDEELAQAVPFSASRSPHGGGVDETAFVSGLVIDEEPLPFQGTAAAAPPPGELEPHDLAGVTGFVRALPNGEVMPFEASAAPTSSAPAPEAPKSSAPAAVPQLSLEQFASLRAELDGNPSRRTEILQRYGLPDEQGFLAIEQLWSERFRSAPATYGEYRKAYDTFSRWLMGEG